MVEAVAMAQQSLAKPHLVIDIENGKNLMFRASHHCLPNAQLGLLAWMADRVQPRARGCQTSGHGKTTPRNSSSGGAQSLEQHSGSVEALESSTFDAAAFDSTNSRLRRLLERHLGPELAGAFPHRARRWQAQQPDDTQPLQRTNRVQKPEGRSGRTGMKTLITLLGRTRRDATSGYQSVTYQAA